MDPMYDEIYEGYFAAPRGVERIAVLEELVRLADSNNDIDVAYQARRQLTGDCIDFGVPEKGIVAFSWCMTQFDKNEDLDNWHSLLWQYKTILELIPIFATVSRDQIVSMQEDMARRLAHYGETERTAHYYRSWNFMRMGEYDLAFEHQQKYRDMRRTGISDCTACERDRQVELACRMGDDEECLKKAKQIMSGRMSCGEVPEFTNAHITRSQLRLGMVDKATARQVKGYNAVRRERKYLGTIGDLLLVVVHIKDFKSGLSQVVRHLPWAVEAAAGELKFRFYCAVAMFFEAFSNEYKRPRKIRIPRELSCWREDDKYDMKELGAWFAVEAADLARQFNDRNGNDRYTEIIADTRRVVGLSE